MCEYVFIVGYSVVLIFLSLSLSASLSLSLSLAEWAIARRIFFHVCHSETDFPLRKHSAHSTLFFHSLSLDFAEWRFLFLLFEIRQCHSYNTESNCHMHCLFWVRSRTVYFSCIANGSSAVILIVYCQLRSVANQIETQYLEMYSPDKCYWIYSNIQFDSRLKHNLEQNKLINANRIQSMLMTKNSDSGIE